MEEKLAELKKQLRGGVAPALATPLLADGYTVNVTAVPTLIDFLLERGVKGLFVGGTTGEGILLDTAQRMRLHETAVTATNGRAPVLLHIGANRMDTAVTLAQHAAQIGADAIAAVTPTYYGMHDEALADYYHTIAAAVPQMPLLLYDIPHMAVNGISAALLRRLSRDVPSLAGVKSSQPNAQILRELLHAAPPHLLMLAGNERIALGSLAMGADGLISGLSTAVPEPFVALTAAYARGDIAEAQQQHRIINQLLDLMPAGARIGGIKQILTERGIDMGTPVPPRPMPTSPIWAHMRDVLE
ncbi:MAG: dihydrodipicolinate synthase family protein [Anaerolineales bacterium]|nr:dihydrodipicolinate synthase family protein [Anaerolineales bacterium]MCB8991449.1 dihydrodipicolinate synthase family protein [Ardenticatenaceae bacterium]MCB9003931.1 dihydrodipicolinate synthase family protein [Ardenticatenaceae bacterium]